jgi:dTDP-4-dehydrorhamnose reductase
MIGNGVVGAFLDRGIDVRATTRHPDLVPSNVRPVFRVFDAGGDDLRGLVEGYGPGDYVINCAGLIKQHIRDDDLDARREAIAINSEFPHRLARRAVDQGFRVIHVTTDCVFSGSRGGYIETDPHDATDVYGTSKSLGEVPCPNVLNVRCSAIGIELREFKSLLSWVLSHEAGSTFSGYTDHEWNGVTAPAFGQVIAGVVATGNPISGTIHLIPSDFVSKYELSSMILEAFDRRDVSVVPTVTGGVVNRVLSTVDPDTNARLWADTTYEEPPSIAQMVEDLSYGRPINGVTQ